MFTSSIRAVIRQQWAGLIALFLVLTGGVAWATHPGGANTISSVDIRNGEVRAADIRVGAVGTGRLATDAVTGAKVLDGTVTGADVDESTLGQVPSAVLGGLGRWTSPEAECDPESAPFFTCAFTSITLPQTTRVLLIGVVKAQGEGLGADGTGQCRLATHLADIPSSTSGFDVGGFIEEHVPLLAITGPLGPGSVDVAVRCNELAGDVRYFDAAVAAVALSPSSP